MTKTVLTRLALLAAGTMLLLGRQSGIGALDTIWAEDGAVFLQAALADPSPRAWSQEYAGYLHLVPRVIASAAAVLPLEWASLVLSGGAALAAAGLVLVVHRAAETLVPGRTERMALSLAVLVLPSAGFEVANAAANIHWYLPIAASMVALWRPSTRTDEVVGSVVLFAASTSDPFIALVAPVVLLNRVHDTNRRVLLLWMAALASGAAMQAWTILYGGGGRPLDPFGTSPIALAQWYGFHVLETAVLGIAIRDLLVNILGVGGSAALVIAVLAYLLMPVARAARQSPRVLGALLMLHAGFYLVPVVLAGTSPPRYALTPIVVLYVAIAWGLTHPAFPSMKWRRRLAVALLLAVAVADYRPWNDRSAGPSWSAELARARRECQTAAVTEVQVPTPPKNLPAGDDRSLDGFWSVRVGCGNLREQSPRKGRELLPAVSSAGDPIGRFP